MSNKKCKTETVADLIKPKKKYLYTCNCIRCNGAKVDYRTQEKHTKDKSLWSSNDARKNQENAIMARKKKHTNLISDVDPSEPISKKRKRDDPVSFQPNNEDTPFPDPFQPNNEENMKSLFSSNFRTTLDNGVDKDNSDRYYINLEEEGEDVNNDEDDINDDDDIEQEVDSLEDFFASPEIDSDEVFVMKSLNDSIETEIVLWVFKFQQRYRLPNVALEALIKFLRIVNICVDPLQFQKFPKSLHIAKNMLNIFQPKMQLAVCKKCHKLHNAKNVIEYKDDGKPAVKDCLHEEFPNSPVLSRRNQCNNLLTILKKRKGKTIAVPHMLYPKPSIRQQISMLYQRPRFEDMLKLSGGQREGNIYSDIYDGEVWKTFSFDGNTFFMTETATTHLGLLFNLD